MQQSDPCEYWLKVAANLRVDRKANIAPHKPLLLLVIAELAEQGNLEPILPLTGELVFRFLTFWMVVANRRSQKPNIRLPFYHMRSDGCWTPLSEDGEPTLERMRTAAARFDKSFFTCIHDPTFRTQLRRMLIARYFNDPAQRAALYDLVGLPWGVLLDSDQDGTNPPEFQRNAQIIADLVRSGKQARLTRKREPENYIAITVVRNAVNTPATAALTYSDYDDAKKAINNATGTGQTHVLTTYWPMMTAVDILAMDQYQDGGRNRNEVVEILQTFLGLV